MKHKVVLLPSYARHAFNLEEVEPLRRNFQTKMDVSEIIIDRCQ